MNRAVDLFLEKVVYNILLLLKRKKYLIPKDTTRENVKRKNVMVNVVCMTADFVTGVLIFLGLNQSIITYVSLASLAAYTFVEQYKIYAEQYKYLRNSRYECCIRQRVIKHERRYTPNLANLVFSALCCIFLIGMCCVEILPFYKGDIQKDNAYVIIIMVILVRLIYIKMKYCFFDLFGVIEFTYRPIHQ